MHYKITISILLSTLICHSLAMELKESSAAATTHSLLDDSFDHALLNQLYKNTITTSQSNCDVAHEPVVVMFSGCTGMGKTTIAKKLEKELNMLRFNGDDTRIFLRKNNYFHPTLPVKTKMARIFTSFSHVVAQIQHLPNKAIIFDESIDRQEPPTYDSILSIVKPYGYSKFVIRLNTAKEIAFKRIMEREKNNQENREHLQQNFDKYYEVYERFNLDCVDYHVKNDNDLELENTKQCISEMLFEEIKKRIGPKNQESIE